ncbi:MAG: PilX N-terminal domain-containing pilus assembly protein, partial [Nanoarchaeota archaeon]
MNKGFATLYLVLLILFLMGAAVASSFVLVVSQQRTFRNTQNSVQAYFAAEAGVEDALLRLKNSMAFLNPISLSAGEGSAATTVTETSPGVHLVVAQGNDSSRIRKVQAVYQLSGTTPEFFYGAHMGAGGLLMDNQSQVIGNVFSNGDIIAEQGSQITGT